MNLNYPNGKDFIFTIFDDTDVATLDYIRPIYDYLYELNFLTTKTVWPLDHNGQSDYKGSHTLQNKGYSEYIKLLSQRGFEISYHGGSMKSCTRKDILNAFDKFYQELGYYPRSFASHSFNQDNLYWGAARFNFLFFRKLYTILSREKYNYYQGHVKGSEFFWGDIAAKHIEYVRNFTFNDINLLNISNAMPYYQKKQPYVNAWFYTSDADNVEEFNRLISEKNQNRLIYEKGVCIISTHFGKGFVKNGELNSKTKRLLYKLSTRNGWFVPVSTVLDFLKSQRQNIDVRFTTLFKLELKWFIHSLQRRKTELNYEQTEIEYLTKQF